MNSDVVLTLIIIFTYLLIIKLYLVILVLVTNRFSSMFVNDVDAVHCAWPPFMPEFNVVTCSIQYNIIYSVIYKIQSAINPQDLMCGLLQCF